MKLDMPTARRSLKSPQSLSGTSAHPTMVTQLNIMVMNGWLTSFSFIVNRPPHSWDKAISVFQTLTLKLQGQGHGCGQRARSHIVPSIQPMYFLFVSHQSDQPFLRYGQNSVWPWKNTSIIFKKICQNNSFEHNFSKIYSGNKHD